MIRKIFLLKLVVIVTGMIFSSCRDKDDFERFNEQTLFIYMPWSTNLTSYFHTNLADMEEAIRKNGLGNGRVMVFLSTSATEAIMFEIKYKRGNRHRTTLKQYSYPEFTTEAGLTGILNEMKNTRKSIIP